MLTRLLRNIILQNINQKIFNYLLFLSGQLLVANQISTTCNLILTVIFLRLFHHGPSPVPRKLRHLVFNIIAPMIFFDVKVAGNKIAKVVPNEKTMKENGQKTTEVDSTMKQPDVGEDEMHIKEWQTVAKVLDKLLFILNIISYVIAFGYGYTILYTN